MDAHFNDPQTLGRRFPQPNGPPTIRQWLSKRAPFSNSTYVPTYLGIRSAWLVAVAVSHTYLSGAQPRKAGVSKYYTKKGGEIRSAVLQQRPRIYQEYAFCS
jgi:hypothetical protein